MSTENEYRNKLKFLIQEYYTSFDETDIRIFLSQEIKVKGWDLFNYLFIRKAIDMALDKNSNEKEACSKLL